MWPGPGEKWVRRDDCVGGGIWEMGLDGGEWGIGVQVEANRRSEFGSWSCSRRRIQQVL